MIILVGVETLILAVLTILVAGLLRAYATVLRRLHELGGESSATSQFQMLPVVSSPQRPAQAAIEHDFGAAHDIAGHTPDGGVASVRVVDVEHDSLLLFLSSGCASCATFWDELAHPDALPLPDRTRLLVVAQGPEADSPSALAGLAPPFVDVIQSSRAWEEYQVPGSPHVVFVNGRTGRVRGEGTGRSLRQVGELLAASTGDAAFLAGGRSPKPRRDAQQEMSVDAELLAAGILPGDPRLFGEAE